LTYCTNETKQLLETIHYFKAQLTKFCLPHGEKNRFTLKLKQHSYTLQDNLCQTYFSQTTNTTHYLYSLMLLQPNSCNLKTSAIFLDNVKQHKNNYLYID